MILRTLSVSCVATILLVGFSCTSDLGRDVRIREPVRPPCVAIPGTDRDPCGPESDRIAQPSNAHYRLVEPPLPLNPEWIYRREWKTHGLRTPQVVVRGVVAPGSSRCSEIRAHNFGSHDYGLIPMESPFTSDICHFDVDVSEYLVGLGPFRLTLIVEWHNAVDRTRSDYGTADYFGEVAAPIRDRFEGAEYIFELTSPPDFAFGDWMWYHSWKVLRRTDGTIVGRSGLWWASSGTTDIEDWEIPLDQLQPKLKAAHATVAAEYGGRITDEPDSPVLVTDAGRPHLLAQLRELGAYDAPDFTPVPAPPAPIPPIEPGDVTASQPNDDGGILISWSASPSGDAVGYKIVRRVPKGEFVTVVADTESTATTYTDTSAPMTAGATYIYRVLALNEYGESIASNRATVELPGPDAPADLTATYSNGDVVLTWLQPGVIQPSCYRIYRRAQGEQSFAKVENCWRYDLRTWTDEDVASGTRYIYRLVPMINTIESGVMESSNTSRASIRVP